MRHQPDVLPEVVEGDAPVLAALAQLYVGVTRQREVQAQVFHGAAVHRQVADLQLALGVGDLKWCKDGLNFELLGSKLGIFTFDVYTISGLRVPLPLL